MDAYLVIMDPTTRSQLRMAALGERVPFPASADDILERESALDRVELVGPAPYNPVSDWEVAVWRVEARFRLPPNNTVGIDVWGVALVFLRDVMTFSIYRAPFFLPDGRRDLVVPVVLTIVRGGP